MPARSVLVVAPEGSPLALWVVEAGYAPASSASETSALVFHPTMSDEAHRLREERDIPSVACAPIETALEYWFVSDNARDFVSIRADAYASEPEALAQALRWAIEEDRPRRLQGPLRVTWLGSLGEAHPPGSSTIGTSVVLRDKVTSGRSQTAHICLRHGPHSDQNTVARLHALFEPTATGALVHDLRSTNGTWVHGERVESAELRPGDEVAIAMTHRLRLDGDPSA